MPLLPRLHLSIHLFRTLLINAITLAVAAGLARNRLRNPELRARPWPHTREAPRVEIIIPARDEERNVEALLHTLLAQAYPPSCWGITVVDDGSTDRTCELAQAVSERHPDLLRVVQAPPLPHRWTGKSHAMYTGFNSAPHDAEWLLFVDADTRHDPYTLSSVVQRAQETQADLLSLVIDVQMESFWERLLVPQVGELYTLLVGTMDEVNRQGTSARAAANGQFMLVRREVYAALGALPQVRGDVAEDRALAEACKRHGYTVRLEYGRRLVHARVYSSLPEMWAGYSKTLFWASGHNLPRALLVALALALYAILPPAVALHALLPGRNPHRRLALAHAPLQITPMLALRAVVCKQVGIPIVYAHTYPLAVGVADAMLLYSVYRVLSGKGVDWKGRTYR